MAQGPTNLYASSHPSALTPNLFWDGSDMQGSCKPAAAALPGTIQRELGAGAKGNHLFSYSLPPYPKDLSLLYTSSPAKQALGIGKNQKLDMGEEFCSSV
jgi:hypothetical protein